MKDDAADVGIVRNLGGFAGTPVLCGGVRTVCHQERHRICVVVTRSCGHKEQAGIVHHRQQHEGTSGAACSPKCKGVLLPGKCVCRGGRWGAADTVTTWTTSTRRGSHTKTRRTSTKVVDVRPGVDERLQNADVAFVCWRGWKRGQGTSKKRRRRKRVGGRNREKEGCEGNAKATLTTTLRSTDTRRCEWLCFRLHSRS